MTDYAQILSCSFVLFHTGSMLFRTGSMLFRTGSMFFYKGLILFCKGSMLFQKGLCCRGSYENMFRTFFKMYLTLGSIGSSLGIFHAGRLSIVPVVV